LRVVKKHQKNKKDPEATQPSWVAFLGY